MKASLKTSTINSWSKPLIKFRYYFIWFLLMADSIYVNGSAPKFKLADAAFQTANIVFTTSGASVPPGYLADNGLAYTATRGFGWINPSTKTAMDMTASVRLRTGDSDPRLNGLVQMQETTSGQQFGSWQYAVPNGTYRVTIGAGDESYFDSDHQINAEGLPVIADLITTTSKKHKISIAVVTVTDGLLNIDATGGVNSKINFITIAADTTVSDTLAPTASVRLSGTLNAGVYTNQVQVFCTATDAGNAGLAAFQYSLNGGAYQNYIQPFLVQTAGNYTIVIKAADANNNVITTSATSFTVQGTATVQNTAAIVFTTAGSAVPTGYVADNGLAFTAARGYGWVNPSTKAAMDMTASVRLRTGDSDPRLNGLVQMQETTGGQQFGSWQYTIANGTYRVTIGAGDENYFNSDHQINAEGLPVISDLITTASAKHKISIAVITVTDGMLSIDATGGVNSKINFIVIAPYSSVSDTLAPSAGVRLAGTLNAGVYTNQVQVFCTAADVGNAGLATFQYAISGGAFQNYTQPFLIQTTGNYTVVIKAADANNNVVTTSATSFSVQGTTTVKSTGAYMVLQNLNVYPSNTHLAFSDVQIPWRRTSPDTTPYNANHNIVKLRINNKGTGSLTLSKLTLSRPGSWSIIAINSDSTATLPVSVAAQGYADISIKFTALNAASRVKIFHDTLTMASNDSIAPLQKVLLDGLWQKSGEGLNEPWTQEIFDLYDFTTNTGFDHDDNGLKGSAVVPNSSEVPASYFTQADVSKPVTVYEIAQYHGCCNAVSPFTYYLKGASTVKTLFTTNNLDGQSVLPREIASNSLLCVGTFSSATPFGFTSDYAMYSDRTKNYQGKIGIRFWKVLDANGNIVPDTYLAGVDYLGTQFSNSDYNDDVYYIQNIRPDSGSVFYSELIATPADVNFQATLSGSSTASSVNLFNSGKTYPGDTADPAITIKSITITGPNASEFSLGSLASSTIAIQSSTTLNVNFNPQSLGIKNAALIINYGTAAPLRIPLYGIANTGTQTITSVKRYKGGSNADVHITNQLWSSDAAIRQGSDELDKQAITSSVACTVADSLYQTYLSATANLAVTNYQIPVTNGNYMVRMHFVENYFNMEGGRIFNISIENQPALLDFDIYKEVGYRAALVKDFNVTVADGNLSVKFTPTVNRVALAGFEIYQANATGNVKALLKTDSLLSDSSVLKNPLISARVLVYPNPGNGSNINISAANFPKNQKVNYIIHSLYGQLITAGDFTTNDDGTAQVKVYPLYTLKKGIYVVNSSSPSGRFDAKFIIE